MSKIDQIDSAIIAILDSDGRASLAELGREVGLSGPAVGERLRRLLDTGCIEGFGVNVNLRALGYGLRALVRIKPRAGQVQTVERLIREQPRFMSCDRVTGDDCYVAQLALADVSELDEVLMPLHDCAETHTSIVKSSLIARRLPPLDFGVA